MNTVINHRLKSTRQMKSRYLCLKPWSVFSFFLIIKVAIIQSLNNPVEELLSISILEFSSLSPKHIKMIILWFSNSKHLKILVFKFRSKCCKSSKVHFFLSNELLENDRIQQVYHIKYSGKKFFTDFADC